MLLALGLITLFFGLIVSSGYAAKPIVVDDVWFVAFLIPSGDAGDVSWTGDGTILHQEVSLEWIVFRSVPPASPGSNPIGSMTTEMDYTFNTKTGEGNAIFKVIITLDEADPVKNPYGIGTLDGVAIAKATSNNALRNVPGDATGSLVCTKGTGAFMDAKLKADFYVIPHPMGIPSGYIFFGAHPANAPDALGDLTYHNPGP